MKFCDPLTQLYKLIQEKRLSVYIEKDNKVFNILTKEHSLVHSFDYRDKDIQFCKHLDINIIGFVTQKVFDQKVSDP